MKRLELTKAASDFAFANIKITDKLAFAQASLAAFVAGGFNSADLDVWDNVVQQCQRQWFAASQQKLPSEMPAQVQAQGRYSQPAPAAEATPAPAAAVPAA